MAVDVTTESDGMQDLINSSIAGIYGFLGCYAQDEQVGEVAASPVRRTGARGPARRNYRS
jgi:hypothetical protein